MQRNQQEGKYYNIECLRFVFAVCIIYFHLLHSFMMPYTGGSEIYKTLASCTRYMKYIVECFFIISGYFLYRSMQKHPDRTVREFIMGRIARLWPVLACAIIISVIFLDKSITTSFLNLFFLQSSGIVRDWRGLNWYVSAFFIAEVFYFSIYRYANSVKTRILTCLIIVGGYAINLLSMNGGFGRKMVYGVINLGLARALAGVGLGYIVGMIYDYWHYSENSIVKKKRNADTDIRTRNYMISLIEIITAILLFIDFFYSKKACKNQLVVVILFTVLFVCLLTRRGVLSQLTDYTFWGVLGKYTYSMYVMQESAFVVLKHTFWKNSGFIQNHPAESLVISIGAVIVMGIFTYYLVEKPGAIAVRKLFSQ